MKLSATLKLSPLGLTHQQILPLQARSVCSERYRQGLPDRTCKSKLRFFSVP